MPSPKRIHRIQVLLPDSEMRVLIYVMALGIRDIYL